MVAAVCASICLAIFKAVESGINHATLAASMAMAIPNRHDMFKTGFLRWKPLEKVADGKFAGEIVLVHVNNLVYTGWRVNRIIDNGSGFQGRYGHPFCQDRA